MTFAASGFFSYLDTIRGVQSPSIKYFSGAAL